MQASGLRTLLATTAFVLSTAPYWDARADDGLLLERPRETDVTQPVIAQPVAYCDSTVPSRPGGLTWNNKSVRIQAYGAFWADMKYETQRTSPGGFTLFVPSAEEQGEDTFSIDARRTRFGLDVTGPTIASAQTGGKMEVDFLGNFVTENRAGVRLRHAYWEAKDDHTRLLVGQYWDVVSPLIPSTLNHGFGFLSGNIGFRRAQFRIERYVDCSESLSLTLQASLNQDVVVDFPTDPGIQREASDWPVVEARAAVSRESSAGLESTLGFSGHLGETGFDFLVAGPPPLNLPPLDDARFKTWSFNIDLRAPLSERLGIQGEFFTGANLSTFLGGVGQGVCPCLRKPIRSTGGWAELWFDCSPRNHLHLGYGVDDPNNNDTLLGRSSNQFLYTNIVHDVTDQLITGLEISYWRTMYRETRAGLIPADQLGPTAPGKSVTIDWMVKYAF